MKFPSDILDVRDIKRFDALEIRVRDKTHITLEAPITLTEESVNTLKVILISYNLIPSNFYSQDHFHKIEGKEPFGEYTFRFVADQNKHNLRLKAEIKNEYQTEAKVLFEIIRDYLHITKPQKFFH